MPAAKKITTKQRYARAYYLTHRAAGPTIKKRTAIQAKRHAYYLANKGRVKSARSGAEYERRLALARQDARKAKAAAKKKRFEENPEAVRLRRLRRQAMRAKWRRSPAGREARRRGTKRYEKRLRDALVIVRALGIKL